jgi:hypothetical protein
MKHIRSPCAIIESGKGKALAICSTEIVIARKVGRRGAREIVDPLRAAAAEVSPRAIERAIPKLNDQNRIPLLGVIMFFGRHAPDSHSELVWTVSEHD